MQLTCSKSFLSYLLQYFTVVFRERVRMAARVKLTLCHSSLWTSVGFFCLVMKSARSTPNSAVACDHKGSKTRRLQREVCFQIRVMLAWLHATPAVRRTAVLTGLSGWLLWKDSGSFLRYDACFCFHFRTVLGNHSLSKVKIKLCLYCWFSSWRSPEPD